MNITKAIGTGMLTVRLLLGAALALSAGLLLSACQPEAQVSTPSQAVASTPVAALPVSVSFQAQATPTAVSQDVIDAADAEYTLLTNIYQRVAPSVVNIDVTLSTPSPGGSDQASGSGFVLDTQGHIVTNDHVVQGSRDVLVTFNDGFVTTATVIGQDVYSDVAVIKVDADVSHLHPVTFGDSDAVRVGERAIAIGNPFGLASSMTLGIVSGLGRQLPSAELLSSDVMPGFNNPSIIQVDTQINPGNSGGPLLNSRGEVIGMNTAIRTETGVFEGVGFAVPSRTIQRVVPQLIASGKVDYSWIGISSIPSDGGFSVAGLAQPLNLPVNAGVLIDAVTPGSPADKAGLHGGTHLVVIRGQNVCAGGDIIVAVDGTYIQNMDELVAYLVSNTGPGDTVNLLVVRSSDTFDVPVTLESRPSSGVSASSCGS